MAGYNVHESSEEQKKLVCRTYIEIEEASCTVAQCTHSGKSAGEKGERAVFSSYEIVASVAWRTTRTGLLSPSSFSRGAR